MGETVRQHFDRRRPPVPAGLARALLMAASIACWIIPARAEGPAELDFTALSLEELMDVEVTSVSKRRQRLADAAAAVFVITQEDIRTSGATNVPELLRMAPGVDVARIDANKWAVSIRGFNGRFATKLLVMIDGRSVYHPPFSNVFWDVQDVVLEDVERVEVIRGPGATLWGANAVNGVINVITKSARDTQGVLLSGGGGSEQRAFATARYGGRVGDALYYRAYAKAARIDDGALSSGEDGADGTDQGRAGFRLDWSPSDEDAITLSGDLYAQDYGTTAASRPIPVPPYLVRYDDSGTASGGNILARWSRALSPTSNLAVQGSYERLDKDGEGVGIVNDIVSLDLQHEFQPFERHRFVSGAGYRYARSAMETNDAVRFDPESRGGTLLSTFVQDEISLIRDQLRFTIGSKLEYTDTTGFEVQPSARVLWAPSPRHSLWAAVSRAVRLPSNGERDANAIQSVIPPGAPGNPGPVPVEIRLFGNGDLRSEELLALELGYRANPLKGVSFDIAAFYNFYDKLRGGDVGAPTFEPTPVPRFVAPVTANDEQSAETYGIEVAADWEVAPWWRLKAAYSFLGVSGDNKLLRGINSPAHQASLRSIMELGDGWELDLWPRYVDNLADLDIDSCFSLDARLAWRPSDRVEFSLVGQNLLDSRREEFVPEFLAMSPTQNERGVYAKVTLRF